MLDFRLSNGQLDAYPVCWTIPLEEALHALEYALVNQGRAPWLTWDDDEID